MRIAAKVDANQSAIVDALRKVGANVQSLAQVGKGCPDLLVAFRGQWFVAEVKDGAKAKSAQALTPDETQWHQRFGACAKVEVWRSIDDALRSIGAIG